MADFNQAVAPVIITEGSEFTNDPGDAGGPTKYGIALNYHPELTLTQIQNMTEDEAKSIYKQRYWYCDGINSQDVANRLLDIAVNDGRGKSIMLLQAAIRALEGSVALDGVFGPTTLLEANKRDPEALYIELKAQQAMHYCAVIHSHPQDAKFAHGWFRRAVK